MFRTDFNHYLQSFKSDFLTSFMEWVSFMGSTYMLIVLAAMVLGAINFKKGILFFNILGWAVVIMLLLKGYYDMPRPLAVDPTLESFGGAKTLTDYRNLQPETNFSLFSEELLSIVRHSEIGRYGFPSGHVLVITALWLGLAALFKRKWLWVLSIALIVLTFFSRMYLGVHYLGDVIGGLVVGVGLFVLFNFLVKKFALDQASALTKALKIFLLAPIAILLVYSWLPGMQGGSLIGINLAMLLVLKNDGMPVLDNNLFKRLLNLVLFMVLYFAMFFLLRAVPGLKTGLVGILVYLVANMLTVLAFYAMGKRFRLYEVNDLH